MECKQSSVWFGVVFLYYFLFQGFVFNKFSIVKIFLLVGRKDELKRNGLEDTLVLQFS